MQDELKNVISQFMNNSSASSKSLSTSLLRENHLKALEVVASDIVISYIHTLLSRSTTLYT